MELTITDPLDMHLHLREDAMLATVAPLSAKDFSAAVIMPNLVQPVDSLERVLVYRREVEKAAGPYQFTPLMTLFFREYSEAELREARPHIIGVKLYPAGITTQSEAGVKDIRNTYDTLELLEELKIPLLVHGETNGFVMDREREFIDIYRQIATDFPGLHLIMEHITTADAVQFLDTFDNVSATVTLHHLFITLDDVAGNMLEPDLFCKPIAKTPYDRERVQQAVFGGHPRLMFGSDSAPHPRHKKECCGCAAGIFSAPVALPLLAQLFEEADCLDKLQGFVSDIARQRYTLPLFGKSVQLVRKNWQVPDHYGPVRPFFAGQTIRWARKTS
ncbi:MAG: dihydroorotase [Desulfobulbus propionicus]|nr:MAG: dihydroorotase [Desulfobulbus propionicus]